MPRSPSATALAAVVAVLALAAAAGALGSADLGGGPRIDDEPVTPSGGERLDSGPSAANQPSGSGEADCGLSCLVPTARSLLGALFVPLSPTLLAGGAVVVGLLLIASRRGTAGDGGPADTHEVASADGIGGDGNATPSDPGYDSPEEDTVVAAFRRLRAAAVGSNSAGDSTALDSLTPRDVHQAAVAAGYDPEAVTTVVRAFEAVRYGDGVTAQREQAVADALADLEPEVAAS